jgi:hypothetical protein
MFHGDSIPPTEGSLIQKITLQFCDWTDKWQLDSLWPTSCEGGAALTSPTCKHGWWWPHM